jgi:hypothetical protein
MPLAKVRPRLGCQAAAKRPDRVYLAKHQEYAGVLTGKIDRVEVITSVRRRFWSREEKAAVVQET